jgi:hypothetical protein
VPVTAEDDKFWLIHDTAIPFSVTIVSLSHPDLPVDPLVYLLPFSEQPLFQQFEQFKRFKPSR